MFVTILSVILMMLINRKIVLDKSKSEILKEIENGYDNKIKKVFNYTGNFQEYIIPYSGYYKITLDGASASGSFAGTTNGIIYLEKNEKIYFYVGGYAKQFNAILDSCKGCGMPGGATDVRLIAGNWYDEKSLASRIMVAGGAGSIDYTLFPSTAGGGLVTGNTYKNTFTEKFPDKSILVSGASQEHGGIVSEKEGNSGGFGRAYINSNSPDYGAVGGGGYYAGASVDSNGSSTGGTSFISGYAGSNAVTSETNIAPTNNIKHYSGKYFLASSMLEGNIRPQKDGRAIIEYIGTKKPNKINNNLDNVRYIKDCINGNSVNKFNYWTELQAVVDGDNIAKSKKVLNGFQHVTDGILDEYDDDTNSCIIVDLEKSYNLDEIAVWHYFKDGRIYNDHKIYVSANNKDYKLIYQGEQKETSIGIRVSAYNLDNEGYHPSNSFYNKLINDNEIKKNLGKFDDKDYIRGNKVNNYLWFSGILWRAYAIDKDKNIRLIADEVVSIDQFNSKRKDNNYENSNIKKWLNEYFYYQLTSEYKNNLVKSDFCLNSNVNYDDIYMNCEKRIYDNVGLLNISEYNYIGGKDSYLYNNYVNWSMTNNSIDPTQVYVYGTNDKTLLPEFGAGIRPVITIKGDLEIKGGSGTLHDPYITETYSNFNYDDITVARSKFGIYVIYDNKKWRIVDSEYYQGKERVHFIKLIYAGSQNLLLKKPYYNNINPKNIFDPSIEGNIGKETQKFSVSKEKMLENVIIKLGYQDYDNCVGSFNCSLGVYSNSLQESIPITATIFLPLFGEIFTGFDSYNRYDSYWTMTPRNGNEFVWRINNNAIGTSASGYSMKDELLIRPVIALDWETLIDCTGKRTGTYDKPCLIK